MILEGQTVETHYVDRECLQIQNVGISLNLSICQGLEFENFGKKLKLVFIVQLAWD